MVRIEDNISNNGKCLTSKLFIKYKTTESLKIKITIIIHK